PEHPVVAELLGPPGERQDALRVPGEHREHQPQLQGRPPPTPTSSSRASRAAPTAPASLPIRAATRGTAGRWSGASMVRRNTSLAGPRRSSPAATAPPPTTTRPEPRLFTSPALPAPRRRPTSA